MKSLTRYISILIAIFGCCLSVSANDGSALLDKAADKFQRTKSISASFTLSGNGNSSNGKITISGDRFVIEMSGLSIWYNGRTQWTYSKASNEVSITEPTPDELQQINPFAIVSAFRKAYSATTISNSNGVTKIRLTPLSSRGEAITSIVLPLNNTTLYPTEIKLSLDNGETITIVTNSIKEGASLPASTFNFDKKAFPSAEIIDLR